MKKVFAFILLCGSLLFGAINLQTATKEELMAIKGIGEKKAEQIIEYRKTNKINSAEDLKNIKGFGDSIVANVKAENKINEKKIDNKVLDKASKN
ncbi:MULTISPECIES: ComEA family DNA-binding protein [Arcobacter]|jgi:competence protein ComEA|uniref:Competence protein ComEA n=1 Tax=Arcobacter ellisii TaxID=913109 RepID=A0A347UC02_9BACT|nr:MULTISPECIES: helix-hairpin-helix domain-containing protein [Arcobacter]AXX96380.1 competence protein, ComEA family [Arcobacter ellisii]MBD3829583.1 helix-hairpin-helix domain-containing protein [Arcobacter sp.]MDD3007236.1 helix-hairpin-helix domain-containing protein [Arcobacter sp.]MDY3205587.1 helix-hairpin-helix domain-containing protein [Arcobacter sp.]RXI32835.1 competence protein ComEA [Arcobacter ellisii]